MPRLITILFIFLFLSQNLFAQDRVMFSNDYPPFNFDNNKGELTGFNIEILQAILDLYNSDIKIEGESWEVVNTALKNGDIQAIGGEHYPGSYDGEYIYTRSVINTSHCFFYNTNYHNKISIEYLRKIKNPRIALWKNDVLTHYLLSINPTTTFLYVDNYPDLLNALDTDDITCVIAKRIRGMYYAGKFDKEYISASQHRILERNMGFKVRKENPELAEMINNGMEVIFANGEYERIYMKWIKDYNEDKDFWTRYLKYFILTGLIVSFLVTALLFANRLLKVKVKNKTKDLQQQLALNSAIMEELEQQKIKAEESDKMKSAFLANMSHEIRTPINGILGFTDLLESNSYPPQEQEEFISIIKQSGIRMLNTINNIIDVSKLEAGAEEIKITAVNTKSILSELFTFFTPEANANGLDLLFEEKDKESSNDIFYTDEYKLISILTNLIKNALKFTKKGFVKVEFRITKEHAEFKIIDTGIGIEKAKQKSIFNQFVQADNSHSSGFEGSGLGLSIVKGYVQLLNGEINIDSEQNTGTTFYIRIPNMENSHKV